MFKSNKIYLVGLSDSFQAQTHSEKHKTPLAIKVNMSGELWKLLVLRFLVTVFTPAAHTTPY